MVDALKSPGAKKSYKIMEDQLGVKLYGDETFDEMLEIQRTGKHPRGEPGSGITSESLKKKLMEGKNPFSDLVEETKKGPKTLEQRRKEAEQALKNKNVVSLDEYLDKIDETPPDKKADGGRAGLANGSPIDPMDPTNKLNEVLNAFRKLSKRSQNKIGFRKFFESYAEENFATGGRAGFDMGGAPSIVLNPEEREMGKVFETDKVEEAIKEIIKRAIPTTMAEIPLTKKGRLRFGFDGLSDKQISGGLDLLGGELNFGAGEGEQGRGIGFEFKKRFADGGRIGLKDGMSRRKFMKIMGGIATLPILGKYIKPAMPLIKKGAEITGPALDKIVETVMSAGKLISQSGKRLKELTTKKKLKDVEVEEDIMDGPSYTIKTKDKTIYYRPGRQDEMGIDDDIIEVIEDTVTKKAGGGIARMLGE